MPLSHFFQVCSLSCSCEARGSEDSQTSEEALVSFSKHLLEFLPNLHRGPPPSAASNSCATSVPSSRNACIQIHDFLRDGFFFCISCARSTLHSKLRCVVPFSHQRPSRPASGMPFQLFRMNGSLRLFLAFRGGPRETRV